MYCANCGSKLGGHARFCPHCGREVRRGGVGSSGPQAAGESRLDGEGLPEPVHSGRHLAKAPSDKAQATQARPKQDPLGDRPKPVDAAPPPAPSGRDGRAMGPRGWAGRGRRRPPAIAVAIVAIAATLVALAALGRYGMTSRGTSTTGAFSGGTSAPDASTSNLDAVPLSEAYATLYDDGELVFSKEAPTEEELAADGRGVLASGSGADVVTAGRQMRVVCAKSVVKITSDCDITVDTTDLNDGLLFVDDNLDSAPSPRTSLQAAFSYWKSLTDISGLNRWDISRVTDMEAVFYQCSSLSSLDGLSSWDTSAVTDMGSAFDGCTSLTDISALTSWDTSSAKDMEALFYRCVSLVDISPLSSWDVSSVMDTSYMFDTDMFNGSSSVSDVSPLSSWDVSSDEDLSFMFGSCHITDVSPLSVWDVSSAKDLSYMFNDNYSLSDVSPLEAWDTSRVEHMQKMFADTSVTSFPSWYKET